MLYDPNSYFFKSFLSYGAATQKAKAAKALEKKEEEEADEKK
eukprot:CAMPEP_0197488262 /NCGR_PEP_ID=MMETSP1311-20131121/3235_1 /TAXON_ID=464262 /ORGANISM="Genus nov. species nov., Strain RCC856" /LENGTH=41 /DNA_ID= /DNA_START= /DNA_END= /DNA_ORIENTATION=